MAGLTTQALRPAHARWAAVARGRCGPHDGASPRWPRSPLPCGPSDTVRSSNVTSSYCNKLADGEDQRVRRLPERGGVRAVRCRRGHPRRGAHLPPRLRRRGPALRASPPSTPGTATTVYVHGSPASRMLRNVKDGIDACLTATLLDGLVAGPVRVPPLHELPLGRRARASDRGDRARAPRRGRFRSIIDHVLPGRWDEVRPPNEKEFKGDHGARPAL